MRERHVARTGRTATQTAFGVTSLGPERAGPAELLALNRGHWEIENRLHHVRDVSCDADRLRIRNGRLAGNLAGLSNAAISIVRLKGRFNRTVRRSSPSSAPSPPAHCHPHSSAAVRIGPLSIDLLDWAADKTDVPPEVVEAALAHKVPNAVEAAYARTDHFEPRRALMDA